MFFNGDEEIGHAKTSNGVAELQTIVPDEAATLQLSAVKPALVGEKRTLSARYEVSAGFPEGRQGNLPRQWGSRGHRADRR